MQDYQKRILCEKEDLDDKLFRLTAFLCEGNCEREVGKAEFIRLHNQVVAMKRYSDVLGERIANFK